jgi:hypothetical protein
MKNLKTFFLIITFALFCMQCGSDDVTTNPTVNTSARNGIFFHHSTGECIWGPNGCNTSVTQEITAYNSSHGLTGNNAFTFSETWWPLNPDDNNEWERWHRIYENQDPQANIGTYYTNYRIIMTKSCFPSSAIGETGQPSDTLDPTNKTIFNYKWHWRHIINVMKSNPNNFFVIWTNAPLVYAETNSTEAYLADQFCRWAKDTLARGLDPQFGTFPKNVFVFDFFHKLADANGFLQSQYATAPNDSHPNAAATELVAPLLVQEMLDAFLAQ